jgi:hypothetical protein
MIPETLAEQIIADKTLADVTTLENVVDQRDAMTLENAVDQRDAMTLENVVDQSQRTTEETQRTTEETQRTPELLLHRPSYVNRKNKRRLWLAPHRHLLQEDAMITQIP